MIGSKDGQIGDQSKQRLLRAALYLFATDGIDAVSLRMINREAGCKNNSALHYHFGNKQALVEALAEQIQNWFEAAREEALCEVELADKAGTLTLDDLMHAFIAPYVKLLAEEEWGYDAVRFLARVEFEGDPASHDILNRFAGKAMERFKNLLINCQPATPRKLLFQRFNFCISSMILGLANHRSLQNAYMGDMSLPLDQLAAMYVDVCAAGVAAPIRK
ncbi:MAG: TetR/AcrR family transcriptional regulator [Alphaproteobacteria bacterium]